MANRLLSKIAGVLPPTYRRTAAGLLLDVKSLPVRITDPSRRSEPWQVFHNIGGGDFSRSGAEHLNHFITLGGLQPNSSVLDIGCGTGRMAWPLAHYLDDQGAYVGFDVSRHAIQHCRRRFHTVRPDFEFLHVDVENSEYRRRAAAAESEFVFPIKAASIDFSFATSVFSHMRLLSVQNYLIQIRRVLRPGGVFFFTAYIVTPERQDKIATGKTSMPFTVWRDGSMVVDPRSPERAIAHQAERIESAVAQAGLALKSFYHGNWAGDAGYQGFQDLFVVTAPASNEARTRR